MQGERKSLIGLFLINFLKREHEEIEVDKLSIGKPWQGNMEISLANGTRERR